jgi:hypothetical protein
VHHLRAGRTAVREERRPALWNEFGLVLHILTAAGNQDKGGYRAKAKALLQTRARISDAIRMRSWVPRLKAFSVLA